ncbi:thiamin pyrophosphokinase 1 [Contarinia nasturtii]|uniref:thiamin pyrophosphokinase 1 n=1 Tax=Contarinia nasturtii TaxID=265458 RepID=UPI0012D38F01|nr:thiamin pyrophosphokinase 1 [Contarinia nasturtii]
MCQIIKWDATSILNITQSDIPYAFIVLNRPILFTSDDFQRLWNNAVIRVLVDGGANRWFKFIADNNLAVDSMAVPSYVSGDMDSITEESTQRLNKMGCKRVYTPDQNETDCTKSLIELRPYLEPNKIKNVLIVTDFGGRIDQTMSQINTLFKRPLSESVNVYLQSHDTLAWLLFPGQHKINVPPEFVTNEVWCGYIPMDGSSCVTTSGLKYDLTNYTVGFGKIVSSSNSYSSSTVSVHCDRHLFWTMGIGKNG